MTGTLERVRKCFGAASVNRLSKEGCTVRLDDAPTSRLIIDLDSRQLALSGHEARCDYIVVIEPRQGSDLLIPLELKSGSFRTSTIVNQLRAGASLAEECLLPTDHKPRFVPVAATGSIRKAQKTELKKSANRVRFLGDEYAIRRAKCGTPLMNTLKAEMGDRTSAS